MSYQVLARKWRPNDFSEVVGQEHVVQALANSLDKNKIHQAYVLSGTRGVGKTTTAVNLSGCLGILEYKTLIIDADPQANSTSELRRGPRFKALRKMFCLAVDI